MTLRPESDLSVGAWITRAESETDAWARIAQGPPGFESYATVHFDNGDREPYRPDPELVALATRIAGEHTTTPERAWFGLWEGWGELEGGRRYAAMDSHWMFGRIFRGRPPEASLSRPAFDDDVMRAPRLEIAGWRSHLLFSGAVADVGNWGARPPAPGWPSDLPQASLTWPADHAWCIASDVDPAWFTIGGSVALIEAVLAHPDLQSEPAEYGVIPPLEADA